MSAITTGLVHNGNQELKVYSVDDTIRDKDYAERPLTTKTPKAGDPDDTIFRFPSRLFADGSVRGSAEATTLAAKRFEGRAMLAGKLHHIEEKVAVGMVSSKNKTYGRDGMTEYETHRADVLDDQLKSFERVFGSNQESATGNGAGDPFLTRGYGRWINPVSGAGSLNLALSDTDCPIPAAHRTPSASCLRLHIDALDPDEVTNRFTKDQLNGVINSMWTQQGGGQADRLVVCTLGFKSMVNTFLQVDKVVDGLTTIHRWDGSIKDKRVGFVVEIYVCETGTLTFQLSTMLPAAVTTTGSEADSTEALFLDMEKNFSPVRNRPGFYPIDKIDLTEATAVAGTVGLGCVPRTQGKILRAYA